MDLRADIQRIECDDYAFYGRDDVEWMEFVANHRQNVSMEVVAEWIEKSFSEHASIGTFSKFAVDLMSLGAPLWFLERANVAALQEIEHTQISFDILNMYLMRNYAESGCIVYDSFPAHTVNVDSDYNRIAIDTAIGGCFGETLSAMTYREQLNEDLKGLAVESAVTRKLNGIAMDEIEHAAFAWTTVKWIIDQFEGTEVGQREWWTRELRKRERTTRDETERMVYREVIPSMVFRLLNAEGDYQSFYAETKESMVQSLGMITANSARSTNVCI